MCGISGAIGAFGQTGASDAVRAMVAAQGHRGPDDEGVQSWPLGQNVVALGNNRLSILDLSPAGHQPMTESSGRYWIAFNGEIYNFRELRKLLDPENCLHRTSTDTEVILTAFDRWSTASFRTLRGMFAFALYDRLEGIVHLVRDPLGIKPLYYHVSGNKILFASEVNALLASGQIQPRVDPSGVANFLARGWVGKSETVIAGINMLPPGHVLRIDLSTGDMTWAISAYGREFTFEGEPPDSDRNESEAHVNHLLEQSVKYHLVSDVPVGLFLSGGIDSTAVLSLMKRAGCQVPRTFTVVFQEEAFNEREFARRVAQAHGSEHTELELSESDLYNQLPAALAAMDQPTMDGINTYVVAHAVRSAGIKVALSGLGSDELFAGYPSFRRGHLAAMAARYPRRLRRAFASVGRSVANRPGTDKLWDLLDSDCTPSSTYEISRRLFSQPEIGALVGSVPVSRDLARSAVSPDVINEISRLELTGYMTGLLLRDTDFMSMASSLEVRVPFVDETMIRYVLHLPGRWKMARSRPKTMLLASMRGAIPSYVWNRRKMGFVLPVERWMRSILRPQLEATLKNRELAQSVGLVPRAVEDAWRGFLDGRLRWSKPWSLFVLLRWCERHRASI